MSTDIVVQGDELAPTNTLFGTDNPAEVIARASVVATTLADLVRRQNLIVRIGQSDHVRVEGWTLLGSMLGVFPVVTWTRQVFQDDKPHGWEARVEARTRSGEVVGAAEAECLRDEKAWGWTPTNRYGKPLDPRDDYALRSMAQTRAVSKALRLPLGFVMQLAGFDPTPADEMPHPTIDMRDPAIPFGDAAFPEHQPPKVEWASAPQKKKLNVLVGKLRPDTVTTEQLWERMGKDPTGAADADGVLHWSPLRDSLTKREAHELIEWLEALDKGSAGPVEPTTAPTGGAPDSGQAQDSASGSPAEHILALSTRLLSAGIEAGKGPETQAWLERAAELKSEPTLIAWLENEVRKLDERMATA